MNSKCSIWSVVAAGLASALICTVVQSCRDETNNTVKATESTRFELVDSYEDGSNRLKVYIDSNTGVHYLVAHKIGGHGVGITVMVDADGKPFIKGE